MGYSESKDPNGLPISDHLLEVTSAAVQMWLAGLDKGDIQETWDVSGYDYTGSDLEWAAKTADILERYDGETGRLLALWVQYLVVSEAEEVDGSAEDFCVATANMYHDRIERKYGGGNEE